MLFFYIVHLPEYVQPPLAVFAAAGYHCPFSQPPFPRAAFLGGPCPD